MTNRLKDLFPKREAWRWPIAEGVFVDGQTGQWSTEAFANDVLDDEDQIPSPTWWPAEPGDENEDPEVWRQWIHTLRHDRETAKEALYRVALARAAFAYRALRNLDEE